MLPRTISFDRLGIVAWSQLYIRISSSYLLIRGTCLAYRTQVMDELHVARAGSNRQGYLRSSYRSPPRSCFSWFTGRHIVRSIGSVTNARSWGKFVENVYLVRGGEKWSIRRDIERWYMEDGYERLEIRGFVFLFSVEIVKMLVVKYGINGVKYGIIRVQ